MAEYKLYCGVAPPKRMPKNGRALRAHGPDRNILLDPLALNRGLASNISSRLLDLIDIGTYVFAADRISSRGGPVAEDTGKEWRREFEFTIAVRDPDHWSQPELVRLLADALGFMSEDNYHFEFVESDAKPPPQDYFAFHDEPVGSGVFAPVILFSGGLDSLAGTLAELQAGRNRVVLVSHQSGSIVTHYQNDLLDELRSAHPGRILHLPVRMSLRGLTSKSNTQRTRTFFFSCIASLVATIMQAPGIRFYENGIMSLNLPMSAEVVGTAASRSTHPRTLAEVALVLEAALSQTLEVDNPFVFKTKSEVMKLITDGGAHALIDLAFTCTEVRRRTHGKSHCGACLQCLHRMFGAWAAGLEQDDNVDKYALSLFESAREGRDLTMIVNLVQRARQFARMKDAEQFFRDFPLEIARLNGAPALGSSEQVTRDMFLLHQRFGREVIGVIERGIEYYKERLSRGDMPSSSLLPLAVGDQTGNDRAEGPPEPATATAAAVRRQVPIRLMIDEGEGCFSINGRRPMKGRRSVDVLVPLAEQYQIDLRAGDDTASFVPTAKLLAALHIEEDALSRRIERLRSRISTALEASGMSGSDRQAVIESKQWHGYRLNPAVRLVKPS
jgi:7-cyano-7-deazaguanine synthase in queuosine biosynthesis